MPSVRKAKAKVVVYNSSSINGAIHLYYKVHLMFITLSTNGFIFNKGGKLN